MRLIAAVTVTSAVAGLVVSVVPATATAPSHKRHRAAAVARPAAPRSPLSYEATPHGSRATEIVAWTNPRAATYRKIVVRYARGPVAPATLHRGHGVHLASRRAHSVTLSRLARDTTYAVSIFAVNRAGRASKPAVARFTTPAVVKPGPRGVLRGIVSDADGHPLAGADLAATADGSTDPGYRTTTDASGSYVLGLPTGTWQLRASGARATGGVSDTTGYTFSDAAVTIRSASTDTRSFRLPAGSMVTGRVVDTAGRPVAGARPYVFAPPTPYVLNWGPIISPTVAGDGPHTDADGRYVFKGMHPGDAIVPCALGIDARVAGRPTDLYSACASRAATVAAGEAGALADITMAPGTGTVASGTLRDADGRPLRGTVNATDGRAFHEVSATTDARGRYRLVGVTPGRYQVCATPSTSAGSRTGWVPACAPSKLTIGGSATSLGVLKLARGAAATGTVTGPGGRRVVGASVRVYTDDSNPRHPQGSGTATTDARGQFRITGLPAASTYSACALGTAVTTPASGVGDACWRAGRDFALRGKRIRSGIDIAMPSAGAVTGHVVTRDGRPSAGGYVAAYSDDGSGRWAWNTTDSHGEFRLPSLESGRWHVCIATGDPLFTTDGDDVDVTGCVDPVTVRRGQVTRAPTLVRPSPTAIAVEVRDTAGEPVSGVDAVALAPCNEPGCNISPLLPGTSFTTVTAAMTDAAGHASLTVVRPGAYTVCLFSVFGTTVSGGSPTGYADACHGVFDVTVAAEQTTAIAMTLQPGGTISGRVTDVHGNGVTDSRIVVPGAAATDTPRYPGFPGYPRDPYYVRFEPALPNASSGSGTDADGRFTIIGVRPGTWSVCAEDARVYRPWNGPARFDETCAASPGVTVTSGADTHVNITGVQLR